MQTRVIERDEREKKPDHAMHDGSDNTEKKFVRVAPATERRIHDSLCVRLAGCWLLLVKREAI